MWSSVKQYAYFCHVVSPALDQEVAFETHRYSFAIRAFHNQSPAKQRRSPPHARQTERRQFADGRFIAKAEAVIGYVTS